MTLKIELGKTYKTRSGSSTYKVVCVDAPGVYPVIAFDLEDGDVSTFTSDGYVHSHGDTASIDLVSEVVPKIVRYVNFYDPHNSVDVAKTKEEADEMVSMVYNRTACIRIEYSPGQFDD